MTLEEFYIIYIYINKDIVILNANCVYILYSCGLMTVQNVVFFQQITFFESIIQLTINQLLK